MITFYEKESEEKEEKLPSVYDTVFDTEINLDDRYKLALDIFNLLTKVLYS